MDAAAAEQDARLLRQQQQQQRMQVRREEQRPGKRQKRGGSPDSGAETSGSEGNSSSSSSSGFSGCAPLCLHMHWAACCMMLAHAFGCMIDDACARPRAQVHGATAMLNDTLETLCC
jgi:hypothetical protein